MPCLYVFNWCHFAIARNDLLKTKDHFELSFEVESCSFAYAAIFATCSTNYIQITSY